MPAGLSGVAAIAAGVHHSLALKSDGTVVAWGYNVTGPDERPGRAERRDRDRRGLSPQSGAQERRHGRRLGDNDFGPDHRPAGLSGVVAIAAGIFHSLALKSDGTVVALGIMAGRRIPAG